MPRSRFVTCGWPADGDAGLLLLLLHLGLGHDVDRGQVVAGGGEDGRPRHRHSLHHFLFGAGGSSI